MILQIKKNCLQFHRMKVEIKEAYDFTKEQKGERISYELEENPDEQDKPSNSPKVITLNFKNKKN